MAIVYQHRRLDTNEIFYIGIGKTEKRAYSKANRNNYWNHIVEKCGYIVEIKFRDISWELACEKEKEYIKKYGRKDLGLGTLVNMTDGGEGITNIIVSDVERERRRNRLLGTTLSDDIKRQMSESQKGEKNHFFGKKHSNETKQILSEKISLITKGRKMSDLGRQNISKSKMGEKNPMFGKTTSEEVKDKLSEAMSGEKNHFFGKKHTEESKNKISEKLSGREGTFIGKTHSIESKKLMSQNRHNRILTEEIVIKIREEYNSGKILQKEIAQKYGVNRVTISDILNKRTWKHV